MPKYTVTAFTGLTLPPATPVRLTKAQLATRGHLVTDIDRRKGWSQSAVPLTFKRGEVVETDLAISGRAADAERVAEADKPLV